MSQTYEFYDARANESAAEAKAAALDNVRERALRSEATWRALADQARAVAVHPFLVRAAQLRGISISGYIRRATMARVGADLGIDPVELFQMDSAITPLGKGGNPRHPDRDLDGALYGRWEVGCSDVGDER